MLTPKNAVLKNIFELDPILHRGGGAKTFPGILLAQVLIKTLNEKPEIGL